MITAFSGRQLFAETRRLSFQGIQLAIACVTLMSSVAAGDAFVQFVEGLRSRGYYDTAVEFLDDLSVRTDLPGEVRDVLDLQRGITLQQMGTAARVPEDRENYLSQAEMAFRKFTAEHANHSEAAFANSSLGELLFERARSLIWQTDSASSADKKPSLQAEARKLIDDAEAIYKKAFDLYETQYKSFPTFIDQARDPEPFQQRLEAEARYLRAWFNLSRCTYERGQTYDKGSDERKAILIKASELFEEIHTSRRTNAIGLNARLMMGKCFQEQDDIGRALGIYNEMLQHKSEHPSVKNLKSIALHYRLICLNDPQKADYQLVLQEATEWLQTNRTLVATSTGLGILWEKAVAEEKLTENRTLDAKSREVLLRQAMADAQQVARYPGAFREPANALNRRLKAALGDKDKEPRDFETAFERARGMIDQVQKLKSEAEAAAAADDKKARLTALDMHLNEVGRLLRLALDLKEDSTDPKAVAQARYLLSFILFRQRKNFDAVIMSTYCMTHDAVADPDTALNATDVAINAAVQAWNDAPANDREFETTLIRDVCLKVFELYPSSAKANEARIRLGFVYQQLQNPLEAAKWFLQVPDSDPQYASARINAGQSFWAAYAMQAAQDENADLLERRSGDDLKKARQEAGKLLTEGIQLSRAKLGKDARPTDEVVAAEVSLASILNLEGRFAESIQRLTSGGDNSVVNAIAVPDGTARPASGIQSQSFTGLTYRLLLRAYVGTQQIEDAIATMALLEKVGGQDITAVYTQLGMELQEELKRLKQANESQRLTEVRTSFEKFLEKVYSQRNPGDYNSLLWIGETYFGLGQGVSDDVISAATYYEKAATAYNEILSNSLTQEPTTTAINLRLARCKRQQHQFAEALAITQQILAVNPLALDAQFEAAHVLSDWGSNGEPQRLMDAIQGLKDDKGEQSVWGWSTIAKRLQQTITKDAAADFKDRFLESRWQLSNSRRRYAETGTADAQSQLRSALAEITIFVEVFRDIDESWWTKFDRLYQDIQADLGESPTPLERPTIVTPVEPDPVPVPTASSSDAAVAESTATTITTEEGGSSILLPILGVCLAAGAAGGFYFLLSKPKKRPRTSFAASMGSTGAPDLSQLTLPGTSGAKSRTSQSKSPPGAPGSASTRSSVASASVAKTATPTGTPAAANTAAPGAGARTGRKPPTGTAKADQTQQPGGIAKGQPKASPQAEGGNKPTLSNSESAVAKTSRPRQTGSSPGSPPPPAANRGSQPAPPSSSQKPPAVAKPPASRQPAPPQSRPQRPAGEGTAGKSPPPTSDKPSAQDRSAQQPTRSRPPATPDGTLPPKSSPRPKTPPQRQPPKPKDE